ncbi:MAG: glycosyl transferase [Saprospiraceae bacterium]|nr:MAG: glycosyl transferase [Saprospiraceae bacterium]
MRKIVILSPAYPLRGGIAASSERLAYALQSAGDQVKIVSFSLQYPGFLFPGKTQFTDDPPPPNLDIETRVNSVNPLNWITTGNALRREKPDLIIVRYWLPFMGPSLGTILRIARTNGHTKVVALVDNAIPHEKRIGDRPFTQYFVGSVDAFLVMSRSVADDLRQFTPSKPIEFRPHPIYDSYGEKVDTDKAIQHLKLPKAGHYILFFGFIRDYKGLDLLLKALADQRLAAMDVRLLLAGEYYGNQEYYEKLITDLGLESRVISKTEFIANEAVKYYFGAAELVVQPYKTATQSGISQMAYHFDKPMVVTNVGGLPEIVEHGKVGYVVPVDPQAIADAMVDYFEKNRQAVLEAGVRENKSRFSWENLVEGVEVLLQKIKK